MRKKDLPEIIFFEEKVGSNGIHCLDYKNSSNIKYIREDVVKNISSKPMLADSKTILHRCSCEEGNPVEVKICLSCDGILE